jgi:serine/threonine protein kinase
LDADEEWQTESSLSDSSEVERFAYIKDFPVQLICLEKCQGTLDELFEKNKLDHQLAASALFQIVMTLLSYQKSFHFTHNDLHTNNIMFNNTDIENLYYKYKNVVYKVPTYGKVFKLIDFGRSIYRFDGKVFCSDSFAPGGDAATQYNCEPYLNEKKPRLDPNYSFDLCRLGCSIYDFIIEDDNVDPKKLDPLQQTIHRWCSDDEGKNVLYKKNGDERYPNFKLYKMIARTVHNHRPEQQLEFEYFKQFVTKEKFDSITNCIDIDALPIYV